MLTGSLENRADLYPAEGSQETTSCDRTRVLQPTPQEQTTAAHRDCVVTVFILVLVDMETVDTQKNLNVSDHQFSETQSQTFNKHGSWSKGFSVNPIRQTVDLGRPEIQV